MSFELRLQNYNNFEAIEIPESETEIIHISDDLLLNSNEQESWTASPDSGVGELGGGPGCRGWRIGRQLWNPGLESWVSSPNAEAGELGGSPGFQSWRAERRLRMPRLENWAATLESRVGERSGCPRSGACELSGVPGF